MQRERLIKELYKDFVTLSNCPFKPQWIYIEDVINDFLKDYGYETTVCVNQAPRLGDVLEVRLDNGIVIGPFIIK